MSSEDNNNKDIINRALEIDKELWLLVSNYDYETNKKSMEENLKNNSPNPYDYLKWDKSDKK